MAEILGQPDLVATYAEAAGLGLADAMNDDDTLALYLAPGAAGPAGEVPEAVVDLFGGDRTVEANADGLMQRAIADALAGGWPVVQLAGADLLRHGLAPLVDYALDYARAAGDKPRRPLTVRTWFDGDEARLLEAWLMHVPGLRLTLPAIPSDAYRLLRSAIRHDYPTVVVEHPALAAMEGEIRPPGHAAAAKVKVMREGRDATVVATSRLVHESVRAADTLADQGLDLEVIDPRWLRPLDLDGILDSVRRTRRCVVAHEGWLTGGAGAEIAALVQQHAGAALAAPVGRVGAEPGRAVGAEDVAAAVLSAVGRRA